MQFDKKASFGDTLPKTNLTAIFKMPVKNTYRTCPWCGWLFNDILIYYYN